MSYTPFKQMEAKLSKRPGVTNPGALSAFIARRKYGNKAVQHAAATGTSLKGHKTVKRHAAIAKFVKHHQKPTPASDARSKNPVMGGHKSKAGYAIPYSQDTPRSPYKPGRR